MSITLNTPDASCVYCRGLGAQARSVRLSGSLSTTALLHCRCLSPVLSELHKKLDEDSALNDWPWAELATLSTPKAPNGPEPRVVSSPFPVALSMAPEAPKSIYTPQVVEPPPSVPNPKKTRKKKG